MSKKGILFIISGFSGVGKGTILSEVLKIRDDIKFSISATTRERRIGENCGEHYHFLDKKQFESMIEKDAFAEYTSTFGYYYGTLKEEIEKPLSSGIDVVLDINVVGAKKIKECYQDAVTVFITSPTFADLRKRLENRCSETEKTLRKRIEEAKKEVLMIEDYDYLIVNDDVQSCTKALMSIIDSTRYQTKRNLEKINYLLEECSYD